MPIDADAIRPRLAAALGTTLELKELIGTGGFAAVFRARDPFLERDVAIKVIDPALGITSELEEQFLREARIVAGVEHPHIVPLYAAESKNGLLYLVMRLLPGQSLADRIAATGPLPPAEAARLAQEVAMALATAHEHGVVHRDIKPDNILLDGAGHATVTDFGISRVTARPGTEARGETLGTPRYMSPEQALGEEVDGRSDIYSLGVVLFEMLTGRVPFEGRSVTELIAKQIAAPAPKVSTIAPQTPAALVALVDRMLTKDRNARPTAAEAVTQLATARTPDAMLTPGQVRRKRWRRRLVLGCVAAASGGVVFAGVVYLIVQFARKVFSDPGPPAALSVLAPAIPDSIIRAARAEGSLHADEQVLYAFVPAGHTTADAVLWTDSMLIRRSPAGARRLRLEGADPAFQLKTEPGRPGLRGYFIMKRKGSAPDTIYDDLGAQQITEVLRAFKAMSTAGQKAKAP